MNDMKVPIPFQRRPFFEKDEHFKMHKQTVLENLTSCFFYYDMLFQTEGNAEQPWVERKKNVPLLFQYYKEQIQVIDHYFQKRDRKQANAPMIQMIAFLITAVYWTNEKPVATLINVEDDIVSLSYTPVNIGERLGFILQTPDHYHSFIQVKSLFDEAEKVFFRMLVKERL
ncbi:YpoC family protein [Alkalihalobacillus sp. LMS39]|uniref:YpoC family protein n=1 Tax=Alkalihalobacillus sp. LMS39 TaxID=2924032 RepID=UPI001FB4E51E|nr:hypothetical protein [Alkalihalobacillus sp. LMS39]UOE92300.1 hypothetical protein MM271_13665 [Alkalihalobacillus sp. LMS39]